MSSGGHRFPQGSFSKRAEDPQDLVRSALPESMASITRSRRGGRGTTRWITLRYLIDPNISDLANILGDPDGPTKFGDNMEKAYLELDDKLGFHSGSGRTGRAPSRRRKTES